MELVNKLYFLILAIIFLTACSNFNQDRMAGSSSRDKQEGRLFKSAYLDSATNHLLAFNKLKADTAVGSPYGFKEGDIVLYPDSVYKMRVASITSDLPLVYNEHVKSFIELYAFRKKDLTERMLGKSELYYPYIEEVLHEQQLPDELKLLTMIESALQPDAESAMEAAGLWQIQYATGRSLGLTINSFIDERRDPYASTNAGITYLKRLYTLYGDWWLAIAAYNCGPGNLNKAIVKAGGVKDYWNLMQYLPRETRNYVPAFIAMVYLYHFQEEHNLRAKFPDISFRAVDTVRIYQQVSFDEIVQHTGVKKEELAFLNPALIRDMVPVRKNGYTLILPINKVAAFEKARADLLKDTNLKGEVNLTAKVIEEREEVVPRGDNLVMITHKVRRGNTLAEISHSYGCSVRNIMDWNALYDPVLQVGKELKIYLPKEQAYDLQASTESGDFSGSSSGSE